MDIDIILVVFSELGAVREVSQVSVGKEKVMVIPWLSRGEGSFNSAVGTSVICNVCCLFFVLQLGDNQVPNQHRNSNAFGSLNIVSIKCYDL